MILKVKQNENPYDVIGNYIEKHIPVIDNIIAVISIDGEIRNELLLVDGEIGSTNNFVWQIDWWEGEENVELIDFFFVSDACKKNNNDLISRQQAIDATWFEPSYTDPLNVLTEVRDRLKALSSAQPERKKGKWHRRFYPQIEMMVCSECQEEFSYDAETGIRDYNYCPNCGADMREVTT